MSWPDRVSVESYRLGLTRSILGAGLVTLGRLAVRLACSRYRLVIRTIACAAQLNLSALKIMTRKDPRAISQHPTNRRAQLQLGVWSQHKGRARDPIYGRNPLIWLAIPMDYPSTNKMS